MSAIPCSGSGCKRTISISICPGGNPVALADPENWATEYLLCRGCGAGFCDRCLEKIGNRVKCNNCGGQLYTPDFRDKGRIQFGSEPQGTIETAVHPEQERSSGRFASGSMNNRNREKQINIFEILLDALCCVMCADRKITTREREAVQKVMEKTKAPWGRDDVNNHINTFVQCVKEKGLSRIVEQTCDKLTEIKRRGKEDILEKCLDYIKRSDGMVDEREIEVCNRFASALKTKSATPVVQGLHGKDTSLPKEALALLSDKFLGEFAEAVARVKQAACAAIGDPLREGGDPRAALTSTGISLLYTIERVGDSFRHGYSLRSQWNPMPAASGRLLCVAVATLVGRDVQGIVVEVSVGGVYYVQSDLDAETQAEFARHVVTPPLAETESFQNKCVQLAEGLQLKFND